MPHAGQEIHGPNGFALRLIKTAAETHAAVLEMEASYPGDGPLPPEHLHPGQDERFEVLEGAMHTFIGGVERRYETGETFEVPAGTPHQMAADGPSRVRWQVMPALRTAELFERLYGGASEGAGPGALVELLQEFSAEIRFTAG